MQLHPQNFVDLKPSLGAPEVQRVLSLSLLPPVSPQALARVVERCRGAENRKLWGVVVNGRVLGVAEYYLRSDGAVYVCNLAVAEESRGRGVGRFLLAALQGKHGAPLALETDGDAIGFYRKCGFEAQPLEADGARRWACRRDAGVA